MKDCPSWTQLNEDQNVMPVASFARDKQPRNGGTVKVSRYEIKDTPVWSEALALAIAQAIYVCEEVSAPDIITGIFSNFDVIVYVLINFDWHICI